MPERLAKIRAMKDKDIDFSDLPDVTELEKAGLVQRIGRPKKAVSKKATSVHLSSDVLVGLKKVGKDWQAHMDKAMREWLAWRGLL